MERQQHARSADTQPDATDLPYLNAPAVVDRLIRDFTRTALDAVGRADFLAYLDFECGRMNSLLLGGPEPTNRYQRTPWNAPGQLGEYVQKALLITGETRLAVRDAFMWYIDRLFSTVDVESDFDAETVEPLIADLRGALTGNFTPRTWATGRK
ncbi:hypothetical protein [Paraburkholderia sp. BL17N1]|uniref:hypothetical protein n=1 Tax=Paraburkholderia sp. BL17N1 TaxID=1938798 RepID=UPI000EB27914|nr:hypothetical protein [Paraburkholderia sp. BL17N1]RKR44584.1 hypothetical protein B0G82_2196 [Paraburkholderia sp. BL17N1]